MVWEPLEQRWEHKFGLLTDFRDREGHCDAPKTHEEEGVKLGTWLEEQRKRHKQGTLDAARRERLEVLGVVWEPFEQRWEHKFGLLTDFRDREWHCDVPAAHEEEGVKLGVWLDRQRTAHREGSLDAARQEKLKALGVVWDLPEERQHERWEHKFGLLRNFRGREGHCDAPTAHEEEGVRIGVWLASQRTAIRQGTLDAARRERLEVLGVTLQPLEQRWEDNFALLTLFFERESRRPIAVRLSAPLNTHEEESVKLGVWLTSQRTAHRQGTLDAARQAKFGALEGRFAGSCGFRFFDQGAAARRPAAPPSFLTSEDRQPSFIQPKRSRLF